MMTGFGMGFGGFGFLLIALFWIVIIAAAIWLLGSLFPRDKTSNPHTGSPESAIAILKKRYARGEISKEEFETKTVLIKI